MVRLATSAARAGLPDAQRRPDRYRWCMSTRPSEPRGPDRHPGQVDAGPSEAVTVGPWRRRTRTLVYENPWLALHHDEVDRPDGSEGIYGVVHFANRAVGVVAVGDDGRLLLVGQHRYTLDEYSWEIPEGGVGDDESLEDGARRELREETGYEAAAWRQLCRLSLSNSVTDERGALFLAEGLRGGVASPDPTEDLELRWATLDEVLDEIAAGSIHDLLTIAGVGLYASELARRTVR
jgi:8-oxo-dGTP pyrophosphatase MutT (NUDIX family)